MNQTMSLLGGIESYSHRTATDFKRYKSHQPPFGRKVRFLNDNGYDGEREYAASILNTIDAYTVKEIYVGRSSSDVELVEFPGGRFNTVMFEDVELYKIGVE